MSRLPHDTSAVVSDHSLSRRGLLASAWWMTGSHLVAQSFAYASLILLARWLPPASFGTVAVGTAVVYVAVLVVDRGTLGAIIVAARVDRSDLARAFRRCLLTAMVLAAALVAAATGLVDQFASGGDAAAVAALALCLPLHAVAIVPTALLQKSMRFRSLAGLTAAANILSATAAVVFAVAGFGVWALVARQLVLFAATAVIAAVLCWMTLRAGQLVLQTASPVTRSQRVERWFLLFGVTLVVTANLDYLVVGASGNAGLVGLYALAFTIAMAPSTHFSEQVGKVLFAATAARPQHSGQRTEKTVRLMAVLLFPLLPVGILAAPWLLPAVLGPQWEPIVVPFQVLLVVGVGHAVINCIGEALSGNGHIAFRAKLLLARCVVTLTALLILVPINGIRGAALAQLLVFIPYAALYWTAGARRADTSPTALARAVRPAVIVVSVQMAAALAVLLALGVSLSSMLVAAVAAAVSGFGLVAPAVVHEYRVRSS